MAEEATRLLGGKIQVDYKDGVIDLGVTSNGAGRRLVWTWEYWGPEPLFPWPWRPWSGAGDPGEGPVVPGTQPAAGRSPGREYGISQVFTDLESCSGKEAWIRCTSPW